MARKAELMRQVVRPADAGGIAILLLALVGVPVRLSAQEPQGRAGTPGRPAFTIPSEDPIPGRQPGALSKANLAKPRPKPPFDLTGNWMYSPAMNRNNGVFGYLPLPKLKAAAQRSYDEAQAAIKSGKAYKNDEGLCYPAGMPEMMTRVWPNQTIQLPTMILMIQMLKSEARWIYLDGRPHADPEIKPPSYSGDSIGHFEGDTLIVETTNLQPKHHWVQPGIPMGSQFKIVERIRLKDESKVMEDTFIMTDPENWEGDWVNTKYWFRYDNSDIEEAYCLPDLNEHLLSTRAESNVR
jgi:hypothetical protein